ncbi:nitroreductase family protein [Candidatus Woesearchaeota archaeon]|nr:nitroreductase family protein [Candidatus Woesearchaeota archaeon]
MDVKKAIAGSRSIRAYKDKPVSDDLIKELIDAARLAPSGNNAQPWMFKIIKSKQEKDELKKKKIFVQDFVYTAPVIIICCTNPNAFPKAKFVDGIDDPNKVRAIRDLSIACQNLVLRATELGLGTCYVGWMEKEKVKDVLGIPKHLIAPYAITVGYAAESPGPRPRKNVDEILLK